ncbi:hypothetical protein HK102_008977, partial [Quaeritorhiza haematococci]
MSGTSTPDSGSATPQQPLTKNQLKNEAKRKAKLEKFAAKMAAQKAASGNGAAE